MSAQLIRTTFAKINNTTYPSYEDLENAVFPLYGPLQSTFPGEGYRDLIDRMIRFKWITTKGDEYTIQIPDAKVEHVAVSNHVEEPTTPLSSLDEVMKSRAMQQNLAPSVWLPTLSFREIYWLVYLNSRDVLRGQWHNLKSLIDKGLVETADIADKRPYYERVLLLKKGIIECLRLNDVVKAASLISDLQDIPADEYTDVVYRLTERGLEYMALQQDAKLED